MTASRQPELTDARISHRADLARPWRWLLLVYFLLLTIGTHLPSTTIVEQSGAQLPDKLIHLFAFFGLTLVLWRSRLIPLTWLVPAAIAVWVPVDEWTQRLVGEGRTVAMDDMFAGWMGVVAATACILVLSPVGSAPLRAARRRMLYLVDLAVADVRFGLTLVLVPVFLLIILFFLPWLIASNYRLNWIFYDPDLHFLPSFLVAASIGIAMLVSRTNRLSGQLKEDMPCYDCGTSQSIEDADDAGWVTCRGCGGTTPCCQWDPMSLPPSALGIRLRFIAALVVGLVVTAVVLITGLMLNGLVIQMVNSNIIRMRLGIMISPWIVFASILGAVALVFTLAHLKSRAFVRMGWRCPGCSHDLQGDPKGGSLRRCPECNRLCQDWSLGEQVRPSGFERHARTVMSITAVSRMTGLVREGVLSRLFGTDALLSSYFFAFLVPNLFRRLFGEGALAAAFLPGYERLNREDPAMASRLATATLGTVLAGLGLVVIIAEVVLGALVAWIDQPNAAIWLLMIMLPYTPLVCAVAILGAMLQVHGRFGPTAAAPIVLNACITISAIVGMTLFSRRGDQFWVVCAMGGAVVVAGLIQVAWSWLALRSHEQLSMRLAGVRPHMSSMFRKAGPMILGLGVLQINTLIDGLIASYSNYTGSINSNWPLDEQAMAVLTFAQRLYQFPLGVFGIAVATAIYPMLARLSEDHLAFGDTARRGLRLVFFIGFPASLGLMLVAKPLTAAIFQGGEFGMEDTNRVAFVLLGYASCVWAYSMIQVITRAFYARGDTMTPVRIALCVVGLNLVLNLVLIWTPLKEAGLAWSTAICATLQLALLLRLLRRHVDAPLGQGTFASMGRTVGLTLVMILALQGMMMLLPEGHAWLQQTQNLAVLVIVGTVIITGGAKLMKMPELRWALGSQTSDPVRSQSANGSHPG